MKTSALLATAAGLLLSTAALAREAKLVRYPHIHNGRIAFAYLGDIWTASDNGQNIQRITTNPARDTYPRFSPDGKWIAFSSDRAGNLDVYVLPAEGGQAKQLTFHSADDSVLGWSPDSRQILFGSQRGEDFMAKLYTVPVEGGMERSAGPDMGIWGTYSPDGTKLAINRRAQSYWRKYYRGSYQSDVTVFDTASKKFTDLTDFDGADSWPMWSKDGHIYFVSDRDGNGLTNIWRVSEKGGKAEKVTSNKDGDVRWPAMSADGKTIVYEHQFGISKLDVATHKVTPISLNINAETSENMSEVRSFSNRAEDYDLAPNGRTIAFSVHGEVFTAPVNEGDVHQVTENPARDREVLYSPDGKWIAFVSDRSGREEIYTVAADGSGDPTKITDLDTLKNSFRWSPDSKKLLFTTSDAKLYTVDVTSKQASEIASTKFGNVGGAQWSPDGKWIAYSKPDVNRTNDVYLIPSAGGQERKVTFDSYSDVNPRFSRDGKKLYFVRFEGGGGRGGFGAGANLWVVGLEKLERDPDDPEGRPETPEAPQGGGRGAAAQQAAQVKDVNIDWDGLKRRTRQITRLNSGVFNYEPAPDSRTIAFVTNEPGSQRSTPTLYTIQDDGRRMARVTTATPGAAEAGEDGPPQGFGGFGGGLSNLNFTRDGRTLFFMERGEIYSVGVPQTPAGGAAGGGFAGLAAAASAATGGGATAAKRRISFNVRVKIDKSAEWAEMFGDAWRTMKYRFYDPKMHGRDWDGMRSKYQPLVEYIGDRQELLNIVNEMIGELNASHTGAAPGPGGREGAVRTQHLGLELEPDEKAGRYKVSYVYEDGPSDKDWVKVKAGDYLIAIDGKPVTSGDNYWKFLNNPLNRRVTVTFNSKPSEDGAWKSRITPTSTQQYSQLRYQRWVDQRKEMTTKLSKGRIGYLHIQAMNPPSLQKFEKELRENRDKEALIIDQRWNGGGNIEQELLAILVQRQYQVWQPRGTEATSRPLAGFFGPKVVLQNWRSASNAEMFPAGFRALGLGKVIGTPTMGAVIGTGSYSLIDGATVRTPGVGVYLADKQQTNMENYGVKPDILIENSPEDNLAGKDRQLETAVGELLKQIGSQGSTRSGAE